MKELIEFLTKNWKVIGLVIGGIAAAAVIPFRLEAVERNDQKQDKQIEAQAAQATSIYKWIEQREAEEAHEQELRDAAPEGMVWDVVQRKYVLKGSP